MLRGTVAKSKLFDKASSKSAGQVRKADSLCLVVQKVLLSLANSGRYERANSKMPSNLKNEDFD